MRPFIEYCNDQRKKATTNFESGLYTLFANSFYGKIVENVRKRMNAKLVTDSQKMVRAAGKATFKRCEIINSDLVLVETERTEITLNKPVAIGFTILEFAKLVMYGLRLSTTKIRKQITPMLHQHGFLHMPYRNP